MTLLENNFRRRAHFFFSAIVLYTQYYMVWLKIITSSPSFAGIPFKSTIKTSIHIFPIIFALKLLIITNPPLEKDLLIPSAWPKGIIPTTEGFMLLKERLYPIVSPFLSVISDRYLPTFFMSLFDAQFVS